MNRLINSKLLTPFGDFHLLVDVQGLHGLACNNINSEIIALVQIKICQVSILDHNSKRQLTIEEIRSGLHHLMKMGFV